ncbi:MAG: hypothetical protein PWP23_814 [Candidatus Sumerlaeota bacterium]|nr:hypothetical protein [Candidatus Sumerlaeota bacterium]
MNNALMNKFSALAIAALAPATVGAQTLFTAPELLTDGAAKYEMSKNPNHTAAFDSTGALHLVYWSGAFATSAAEPSHVYHREWTEASGWSAQTAIDDSTADQGSGPVHIGGRHPSLAIAPNDDVWVVWHDYRHTSTAGNSIDNIEIYADRKPAGGNFSTADIRITETNNALLTGDNGYTPRVAIDSQGRVSIVWYDFARGSGSNADIYAKHSDASGVFNAAEALDTLRLTDAAAQGALFAYSTPDIVRAADGTLYGVWTSGFGGAAPTYFAALPNPSAPVTVQTIRTATGGHDFASKITAAPNGDVWVVATDRVGAASDVRAIRRPAGTSTFEAAIDIAANPAYAEESGDLEVDADGNLHAVWVDYRDGAASAQVYYARFAAGTWTREEELALSDHAGAYFRPELVLNAAGEPTVIYEEQVDSVTGALWFVRAYEPAAARHWQRYE